MSEWNNLKSNERITKWKNFRDEISVLDSEKQIQAVADFFATVPIGSRSIDYYTPSNWLTPWEILYEGCYCKSSISLLMYYTLTLVLNDKNTIDIALIDDGGEIYLMPVVNNINSLNYEYKTVSNWEEIKKNAKVVDYYTSKDIKKLN